MNPSSSHMAYEKKMHSLSPTRGKAMQFLLRALPESDIQGYDFTLFLEFVDHALLLRETMDWCAALSEDDFLQYVLCPRVNDEDISSHRPLFYSLLHERVRALHIEQAVLEVNRWCHEIATYQAQDDRTASPLTVYRCGTARCGEQSTFAVAALRSVGIAARQVYAPRWSHCDDNHAWVEALCGDEWRFFGACEPEPVLNRGWFNSAASRAVLQHTRRFVGAQESALTPTEGEFIERRGKIEYYNQTPRYAKTQLYTFRVVQNKQPAARAVITLSVLNESHFQPIAQLLTNDAGEVQIQLGFGDIHLEATLNGQSVCAICHGQRESSLTLTLCAAQPPLREDWDDFDFHAPADSALNPAPLTPEQKEARSQELHRGGALRQARIATFYDEQRAAPFSGKMKECLRAARGNFDEIYEFLQRDDDPMRVSLVCALSDKDYRDSSADMLETHLAAARPFAGKFSDDVFQTALLCPRISTERLTPWRAALANAYSPEQQALWLENPLALWENLLPRATDKDQWNTSGFAPEILPPDVSFALHRCNTASLRVLFVALLRALGLPARLSGLDGVPEYWRGNAFCRISLPPNATLRLTKQQDQRFVYRLNWTLARYNGGGWQPLFLPDENWRQDEYTTALPAGSYRLTTTTRLPSGNQFASTRRFELTQGENVTLPLRLRDYCLADLLVKRLLPPFWAEISARRPDGMLCHPPEIHRAEFPIPNTARSSLLFWLQEGTEPTEHVLNELTQVKQSLQALPVDILFFLQDTRALAHPTLSALLNGWSDIQILTGEWQFNLQTLAYHFQCDPESPPLILACDSKSNVVYATSGYNVGSVELLTRIVAHLAQGE